MNKAMIFIKSLYKRFLWNGGRQKLGFFSLIKYFEFIDVNRTVYSRVNENKHFGGNISHYINDSIFVDDINIRALISIL